MKELHGRVVRKSGSVQVNVSNRNLWGEECRETQARNEGPAKYVRSDQDG